MTIPRGNPDADMHALVLQLLGGFSSVQGLIDEVAGMFFAKRMPKARDIVMKLAVSRIRDDERVRLFLAIAEDAGGDADLASFKTVYNRTKELRDSVAHSARIHPIGFDQLMLNRRVKSGTPVRDITRPELLDALRDCGWMEAQIVYTLVSSGLTKEIRMGSTLVEAMKPTQRPEDWDGETFRVVEADG